MRVYRKDDSKKCSFKLKAFKAQFHIEIIINNQYDDKK